MVKRLRTKCINFAMNKEGETSDHMESFLKNIKTFLETDEKIYTESFPFKFSYSVGR